MPDEGKIEWSKNVRVGYLDQHTVLEQGQTIRDVLQSAFGYLFDLEAQMNAYYAEMAEADAERMEFLMEETGSIQETLEHHDFYIIDSKVDEIGRALGLADKEDSYPAQLSGGQQQRTSIGRAIVKNPDLLLCDEPTGALDYKTSKEILKLIEDVNKKYGNTVVLVTHNDAIKNMADRVIKLRDGQIRHDIVNTKKIPAQELDW